MMWTGWNDGKVGPKVRSRMPSKSCLNFVMRDSMSVLAGGRGVGVSELSCGSEECCGKSVN